ncbi:hypothetical protein VK98_18045 [Chromobacterium sp. LK11]|uniref:hypothetical protein n=1 Tax=Chromobacterium sp. LK11 TaxID=1628212 RepID=UPI000654A74A|nr:hypothetical protein [Chromobacterium sp. LK11]KMN78023.1 hypothetical protein VK98_18045 [Chromobacterium sp. LK11]
MPVDLESLRAPDYELGEAPRFWVWLLILLLVMGCGAGLTLYLWPADAPASGWRFWTCLLGLPFVIYLLLFTLRMRDLENWRNQIYMEEQARQEVEQNNTQFGQQPLSLLHGIAWSAAGDLAQTLSSIQAPQPLLASLPVHGRRDEVTRHTHLPDKDTQDWQATPEARMARRVKAALSKALSSLHPALRALPAKWPLHVELQIDTDGVAVDVMALWRQQSAWREVQPAPASETLVAADGMARLDQWLDQTDPKHYQDARLIIAAQFYERPPANSAEAVCALLLAWPQGEGEDRLHRPVGSQNRAADAVLAEAQLFGDCEPEQLAALWSATGQHDDAPWASALIRQQPQAAVVSIDRQLGHAGVAAEWLALLLAWQAAGPDTPQGFLTRHGEHAMLGLVYKESGHAAQA